MRAIREQVASAVDLIVHQTRFKDGSRRITHITEVERMEGDVITLQDIFVFDNTAGFDADGRTSAGCGRPGCVRSSSTRWPTPTSPSTRCSSTRTASDVRLRRIAAAVVAGARCWHRRRHAALLPTVPSRTSSRPRTAPDPGLRARRTRTSSSTACRSRSTTPMPTPLPCPPTPRRSCSAPDARDRHQPVDARPPLPRRQGGRARLPRRASLTTCSSGSSTSPRRSTARSSPPRTETRSRGDRGPA